MTAFDKAWDVLKGTDEEEEADMRRLQAIRDALQRGPPYGNQGGQPEKQPEKQPYKPYPTPPNPYRDKSQPNPFDPYRKNPSKPGGDPWTPPGGPPNKPPYKPPNPYGGDDWATCPDCGQRYKTGMDMVTGKPKQCPCKDGGAGVAPNPYGPPPGAPPAPFQRQSIGFPKDWQTANMTSNPPQ